MIINRIYATQNLLSLYLVSFLVGLRTYQHPCRRDAPNVYFPLGDFLRWSFICPSGHFVNTQKQKVNQSHYSSGQSLRVAEVSVSQISVQSAHEAGHFVSPNYRPPLLFKKYSWYSFLLEAESTPGPQCGRKDYINEKFHLHNRESTGDLQTCSSVPEPTATPGAPKHVEVQDKMKGAGK